jgi:hypothetical protein
LKNSGNNAKFDVFSDEGDSIRGDGNFGDDFFVSEVGIIAEEFFKFGVGILIDTHAFCTGDEEVVDEPKAGAEAVVVGNHEGWV